MGTEPEPGADRPAFVDTDLRGARFVRADLSGAVMRGGFLDGADLDAPWLTTLLVNGVDVVPLVEAELDRRWPGRELRHASDPEGLRRAWAAVETAWQQAVDRVVAMPEGSVDAGVDGEWSFAQTVRHLVMATDTWLRRGVLGMSFEEAYHPAGLPNVEYASDGYDLSYFSAADPTWDEVLVARAGRQAMMRDVLAGVTPADLDAPRRHPWAPEVELSVRECLHTVLGEEWSHLRYAVRDLDALAAGRGSAAP